MSSVENSCEDGKGVSQGSLPIYVKHDTRQSLTAHLVELNGTNETKSAVIDDALQARIVAFTSRPCASCGGYEYAFLDDGRLICPCYFAKLGESKKPRPQLASMDLSEAGRGLPKTCCQCSNPLVYFGPDCTGYCARHRPLQSDDAPSMQGGEAA